MGRTVLVDLVVIVRAGGLSVGCALLLWTTSKVVDYLNESADGWPGGCWLGELGGDGRLAMYMDKL